MQMPKRLTQALLLAGSALLLSGCVAAAVIPILAGSGAIARRAISDDARSSNRAPEGIVRGEELATPSDMLPPATSPPSVEPAPTLAETTAEAPATPAGSATSGPEPVIAMTLPTPSPARPALAATEPPIAPAEAFGAATVQTLTSAPAPIASDYSDLRSYALGAIGGGLPLPSAQLADPTSLQPVRARCEGNTPTIVFDLDPSGGLVPLVGPLAINVGLAPVLVELRSRDINIAWLTDRTPIDARAVRDRLVAANLDPEAADAIYVERYPGETKQARRDAIAQTSCVIAMAGDAREDFDDLYNFIIDEGDARDLEVMLGNGWFLIENPVGE